MPEGSYDERRAHVAAAEFVSDYLAEAADLERIEQERRNRGHARDSGRLISLAITRDGAGVIFRAAITGLIRNAAQNSTTNRGVKGIDVGLTPAILSIR